MKKRMTTLDERKPFFKGFEHKMAVELKKVAPRLPYPILTLHPCPHCDGEARSQVADFSSMAIRCTRASCGSMIKLPFIPDGYMSKGDARIFRKHGWARIESIYMNRALRRLAKRWNRRP